MELKNIKEVIQSSNINFLLGSGVSRPFLPTLNSIEKDINDAILQADKDKQVEGYKKYFNEIMLPNKKIISREYLPEEKDNYQETKLSYELFFKTIMNIILSRKTTTLTKQVNVFTTNIDVFIESTLEELQIDYNDGFSGRINPIFSLSNFKKSIFQRSLHFDHKSEIPVFNLFKIHGSLTWTYSSEDNGKDIRKIYLSPRLDNISEDLNKKNGDEFINEYKENILVVNPENSKFSETVLNKYYYELLRSYSSELEKENSVLFVIGFSMEDQHIREITQRAAKSNPTLKIYILVYSKIDGPKMQDKMEITKYQNIEVIVPDDDQKKNDLKNITNEIFCKVINKENE